jgi:multidrug transporter EmrE-like cation transporter
MPSFDAILPSPGFRRLVFKPLVCKRLVCKRLGFKLSASTSAYLKLLFCAVLSAAAEVFLKVGADAGGADATMNFSALAHAGTWIGIVFFVANFVVWLDVLRTVPVGIAFAVQAVVQLMVPVAAWAFLNEQISAGRALGIILVFAGVIVAAAPSALAEERL